MRRLTSLHSTQLGTLALAFALLHCSADTQPPNADAGGSTALGAPTVVGAAGSPTSPGGTAPASGSGASGAASRGGDSGTSAGGASSGASAGGTSAAATSAGSGPSAAGAAQGGRGGEAGTTSTDTGCSSGEILCEDFEQYPAARAPAGKWTATQRGDGKIVVDATRAASGKQSLHVTGRMNADRANIARPIQTDSATVYVRFMLYTASYPASAGVHTRLMRIGTAQAATGNPETSYSLSSYNGTAIEKVNSIYLRDTATKLNDPSTLNRWRCWEFAVDKSGGAGKVKVGLWVDGRELSLSAAGSASHGMTSPSWDPIAFESFMLGLDGFQADTQPADFWIDDLSVTPERVGCKAAP